MDFQANQWRLCRLIDDSLRQFTELDSASLTPKVIEDILIRLSQVYRRILDWTPDFSSDSDDEKPRDPADNTQCSHALESCPNGHRCITKIIERLMFLIALENQYIQHLVCNTLLAISEFLISSEIGLHEFIQLLCCCLKISIHSSLSSSVRNSLVEANSDFGLIDSMLFLKLKLENADCKTAAVIIQVLRNILKLKLNNKILEEYLHFITDVISNMPWDIIYEDDILNRKCLTGSVGDVSLHRDTGEVISVSVFYGHLLQLLSSLVRLTGRDLAGTSVNKNQALFQIRSLVPKILAGCIGKLDNLNNICIFRYLRHKILMLMLRLSFAIDLERSVLVLWMNLINEHFQGLLSLPIKVIESDQVDCLEGSPFWTDELSAGRLRSSSCHLQRLAIFLFLRCSFTLLSMKEKYNEEFPLASSDSCLTFDLNLGNSCSEGLSELRKWLHRHLPGDIFVDDETYSSSCMKFASSFLQLYMHEDDILFEMLLQIFCLPSCSRPRVARAGISAAKNDTISLVSDLFSPIDLFHLFLAEIHYDYQVLLDYLISNDTGGKCAEYLLRCLRLVCDSWTLFVEFPSCQESPTSLPPKRRRVSVDGIHFESGFPNASLKNDLILSPLQIECKKGHTIDSEHGRKVRLCFEDAKDCLLSLKASIDSLHQKNLFPYNPRVLLQRLTRFQELCLKQVETQHCLT